MKKKENSTTVIPTPIEELMDIVGEIRRGDFGLLFAFADKLFCSTSNLDKAAAEQIRNLITYIRMLAVRLETVHDKAILNARNDRDAAYEYAEDVAWRLAELQKPDRVENKRASRPATRNCDVYETRDDALKAYGKPVYGESASRFIDWLFREQDEKSAQPHE